MCHKTRNPVIVWSTVIWCSNSVMFLASLCYPWRADCTLKSWLHLWPLGQSSRNHIQSQDIHVSKESSHLFMYLFFRNEKSSFQKPTNKTWLVPLWEGCYMPIPKPITGKDLPWTYGEESTTKIPPLNFWEKSTNQKIVNLSFFPQDCEPLMFNMYYFIGIKRKKKFHEHLSYILSERHHARHWGNTNERLNLFTCLSYRSSGLRHRNTSYFARQFFL